MTVTLLWRISRMGDFALSILHLLQIAVALFLVEKLSEVLENLHATIQSMLHGIVRGKIGSNDCPIHKCDVSSESSIRKLMKMIIMACAYVCLLSDRPQEKMLCTPSAHTQYTASNSSNGPAECPSVGESAIAQKALHKS